MKTSLLYTILTSFLLHVLAETSSPAEDLTEVATVAGDYSEEEVEENGVSDTPPPFFADSPSNDNDDAKRVKSEHVLCMFGLQSVAIKTLNNTLYNVRQYDPLSLGEIPDQYLTEGSLEGLSSLRNISALEIICGKNTVMFIVKIGIDSPYVRFLWEKRVIFLFQGSLWMRADRIEIKLVVEMDSALNLNLKQTKITKLNGFRFGFSGLGPLNPFVSLTVNFLEKIWKTKVKEKLENIMHSALQKEVQKVKVL